MRVAVNCDLSVGYEVARSLSGWLEEAEAGDMDGDEMLSRLSAMTATLEDLHRSVARALGT